MVMKEIEVTKVTSILPKSERFKDDRRWRYADWYSAPPSSYRGWRRRLKEQAKKYAPLFKAVRLDRRFALPQLRDAFLQDGVDEVSGFFERKRSEMDPNGKWGRDEALLYTDWLTTAAHPSLADPTKIACYPTMADAKRGREVVMTAGRYYTQAHPSWESSKVQSRAEWYILSKSPLNIEFIGNDDPDGWAWAYCSNRGFSSCMTGKSWEADDPHHPARFYAREGNGLALAILRCGDGGDCISARCIVNVDRKKAVRCYGDARLAAGLEKLGYAFDACGALVRVECNRYVHNGSIVAPYVDGIGNADDRGDHILLGVGHHDCQMQYGYLDVENDDDTRTCDDCGESCHEDDLRYSEHHEESLCPYCADRNYTYAIVRFHPRYPDRDYVRDDCVIEVGGENWLDDDSLLMDAGFVKDEDGEWQDVEDCIYLEYLEEYVLLDHCVKLDRPFVTRYGDSDEYAREVDTIFVTIGGQVLRVHEDWEPDEPTDEERVEIRQRARRRVKVRTFSRGPQRRKNTGRRRAAQFNKMIEGYN